MRGELTPEKLEELMAETHSVTDGVLKAISWGDVHKAAESPGRLAQVFAIHLAYIRHLQDQAG